MSITVRKVKHFFIGYILVNAIKIVHKNPEVNKTRGNV
jgi:hypothetical protein